MNGRMYTDKEYLEQKFANLELILNEIKDSTQSNTNRIGSLEVWRREIMIKVGLITGIVSLALTLFKDWLLDKLNIRI